MTVLLLKYNNYYNRTIKRWITFADLYNNGAVEIGSFENINFNPKDSVSAELTLNYDGPETPNYVAIEDRGTFSGWFIIDAEYIRLGQYHLTLRRDLVNDLWSDLAESPLFVEKATLPASSPLIFNSEAMTYNQIKTAEIALFDETRIPWIVGYIEQNMKDDVNISISTQFDVVGEYTGWEAYPYKKYVNDGYIKGIAGEPSYGMKFFYTNTGQGVSSGEFRWLADKLQAPAGPDDVVLGPYLFEINSQQNGYKGDLSTVLPNWYLDSLQAGLAELSLDTTTITNYLPNIAKEDIVNEVRNENDKIYKVNGKYYKMKVSFNSSYSTTGNRQSVATNSDLGLKLKVVGDKMLADGKFSALYNSDAYSITYDTYGYTVEYQEITDGIMSFTLPRSRRHTQNAPYDIFCIPYGMICWGAARNLTQEYYGWVLAQTLIKELGDKLYDIQLLPYCPIRNKIGVHTLEEAPEIPGDMGESQLPEITVPDIPLINISEDDFRLSILPEGALIETTYTGLAWVQNEDFSFSLTPLTGNPTIKKALQFAGTATDVKVANETDVFRLTSPNYNGSFEFSAQKNGGVQSFDVDCSYKPYQPYIRISPRFGGLYGQDFNDARGLILGGDFSLPQISSAWTQYQNNNKNYQVMFDRQIANMNVNNDIQREMEMWNVGAGTISGIATGLIGGSSIGQANGGAIGATIGGLASLFAGLKDISLAEKARGEALDYTKDMFGYQLGNIQAVPTSLTKVSAFNPNNKKFPVLEYYTASKVEKDALREKLRYNGMTVMTIGTISQYLQEEPSYIKGKLVRFNNQLEDYHIINELANELNKGIYI